MIFVDTWFLNLELVTAFHNICELLAYAIADCRMPAALSTESLSSFQPSQDTYQNDPHILTAGTRHSSGVRMAIPPRFLRGFGFWASDVENPS